MEVLPDKRPFSALHSAHHADADRQYLECVLLHVEETQTAADGNASTFQTLLEWLTFSAGLLQSRVSFQPLGHALCT